MRFRQGHQAEDTRAHTFQNAFDDAALARRVPTLEEDDNTGSGFLHPVLQFHQFDLQLEKLGFVFLVLQFC